MKCLLAPLVFALLSSSFGSVVINEVADKGTSGNFTACNEEEWVELANTADTDADVSGYRLSDDKGFADDKAYVFPEGTTVPKGGKLLVCRKTDFQFKIGEDDTVTLWDAANGTVDSTGSLPGEGQDNKVFARFPDGSGGFNYSHTPTPGGPNLLSVPVPGLVPHSDAEPARTPPSAAELANPSSACARLRADFGIDCNACVEEGTVTQHTEASSAVCAARTVEDDTSAELQALFGGKPRGLFDQTNFLFATDKVWKVELDVAAEQWEAMLDNPSAEEYHSGTVRLTRDAAGAKEPLANLEDGSFEWRGVGIRFKGFYGSLRYCLHPHEGFNPQCTKLSYKLKFDHTNSSQRFFGLKRLQLHAAIHDTTKMVERLSYGIFREMGIPAVRSAFSTVELVTSNSSMRKSTSLGVHLLTEVIDGRFTETYYSGGDGNLFKEAWPHGELEDGLMPDALETNRDQPYVSRLAQFGAALDSASDDYELATVVRNYSATKRWAKYMAVDRAIEHWDGPVNFRADISSKKGDGYANHNYYLYEEDRKAVAKREFELVPWDMDSTFQSQELLSGALGDRPEWDAPVCEPGGSSKSSEGCIGCEKFTAQWGGSQQVPPSCDRITRAFGRGLRRYYIDAAAELMEGPMQQCRLEAKVVRWMKELAPFLSEDQAKGIYPEKAESRINFPGFEKIGRSLISDTIPDLINNFAKSVSCDRKDYDFDAWGESINSIKVVFWDSNQDLEVSRWLDAKYMPTHPESSDEPIKTCDRANWDSMWGGLLSTPPCTMQGLLTGDTSCQKMITCDMIQTVGADCVEPNPIPYKPLKERISLPMLLRQSDVPMPCDLQSDSAAMDKSDDGPSTAASKLVLAIPVPFDSLTTAAQAQLAKDVKAEFQRVVGSTATVKEVLLQAALSRRQRRAAGDTEAVIVFEGNPDMETVAKKANDEIKAGALKFSVKIDGKPDKQYTVSETAVATQPSAPARSYEECMTQECEAANTYNWPNGWGQDAAADIAHLEKSVAASAIVNCVCRSCSSYAEMSAWPASSAKPETGCEVAARVTLKKKGTLKETAGAMTITAATGLAAAAAVLAACAV